MFDSITIRSPLVVRLESNKQLQTYIWASARNVTILLLATHHDVVLWSSSEHYGIRISVSKTISPVDLP